MSRDEFWPGYDDCIGAGSQKSKRNADIPIQYWAILEKNRCVEDMHF